MRIVLEEANWKDNRLFQIKYLLLCLILTNKHYTVDKRTEREKKMKGRKKTISSIDLAYHYLLKEDMPICPLKNCKLF